MSPVLLPDAVALVIDYLGEQAELTVLTGGAENIAGATPDTPPQRWLRITRVGGLPAPPAPLDHADLQVDAFAENDVAAALLARTAQAFLFAAVGHDDGDGLITAVEPWTGLQNLPDTSRTPPTPRVLFGVTVSTRPV